MCTVEKTGDGGGVERGRGGGCGRPATAGFACAQPTSAIRGVCRRRRPGGRRRSPRPQGRRFFRLAGPACSRRSRRGRIRTAPNFSQARPTASSSPQRAHGLGLLPCRNRRRVGPLFQLVPLPSRPPSSLHHPHTHALVFCVNAGRLPSPHRLLACLPGLSRRSACVATAALPLALWCRRVSLPLPSLRRPMACRGRCFSGHPSLMLPVRHEDAAPAGLT